MHYYNYNYGTHVLCTYIVVCVHVMWTVCVHPRLTELHGHAVRDCNLPASQLSLLAMKVGFFSNGKHSSIRGYRTNDTDWSTYTEWLDPYCTANDVVGEDKNRVILLRVTWPSTYRLVCTESSLTFAKVLEIAQAMELATRDLNSDLKDLQRASASSTPDHTSGAT